MNNKKRVLIIDDSDSSLLLMELLVVTEGYTAFLAESVEKALDLINKNKPDLILLDLQLPVTSGYDFLKMKDTLQIQNVPIIVISAFDSQANIDLTKKLGASEFVPKPVNTQKLQKLIRQYLQ